MPVRSRIRIRAVFWLACLAALWGCSESLDDQWKREFKENLIKAEQGNGEAMNKVAYAYSMGFGAEKNPALAASWWEKCRALDNMSCKIGLAHLYYSGAEGVPQDQVKARALYEEIVAKGGGSEFNLADMYRKGEGGPTRYDAAAGLYRKVIVDNKADQGHPLVRESARFLDEMLSSGKIDKAALQATAETRCVLGRAIAMIVRTPEFCPMLVLTQYARDAINTFNGDAEFNRCLKEQVEKVVPVHYSLEKGTIEARTKFCKDSEEVFAKGLSEDLLRRR